MEFEILSKLDAKVINDKSLRNLNNRLHEINDVNVEYELKKVRTENAYGNCLLEMEKFRARIEEDKFDLSELVQRTRDKKKEVDQIETQIKNTEDAQKQKERKMSQLSRKIDEVSQKFNIFQCHNFTRSYCVLTDVSCNRWTRDSSLGFENCESRKSPAGF